MFVRFCQGVFGSFPKQLKREAKSEIIIVVTEEVQYGQADKGDRSKFRI